MSQGPTYGEVAVEEKQIHKTQGELEKAIVVLCEVVQIMENRLEPVLTPPTPEPKQTENSKAPDVLCGLAADMKQRIRDVDSITERVQDIGRRLQI